MAKSAALTKLKKLQMRRSAAASRARAAARQTIKEQQGLMIAGGTGFGMGFAENQGFALPTFDRIDPVVLYAALSFAGAMFVRDKQIRDIFKSTTIGLTTVALYKGGRDGLNALFQYTRPTPTAAAGVGWGEEVIETGEF